MKNIYLVNQKHNLDLEQNKTEDSGMRKCPGETSTVGGRTVE